MTSDKRRRSLVRADKSDGSNYGTGHKALGAALLGKCAAVNGSSATGANRRAAESRKRVAALRIARRAEAHLETRAEKRRCKRPMPPSMAAPFLRSLRERWWNLQHHGCKLSSGGSRYHQTRDGHSLPGLAMCSFSTYCTGLFFLSVKQRATGRREIRRNSSKTFHTALQRKMRIGQPPLVAYGKWSDGDCVE